MKKLLALVIVGLAMNIATAQYTRTSTNTIQHNSIDYRLMEDDLEIDANRHFPPSLITKDMLFDPNNSPSGRTVGRWKIRRKKIGAPSISAKMAYSGKVTSTTTTATTNVNTWTLDVNGFEFELGSPNRTICYPPPPEGGVEYFSLVWSDVWLYNMAIHVEYVIAALDDGTQNIDVYYRLYFHDRPNGVETDRLFWAYQVQGIPGSLDSTTWSVNYNGPMYIMNWTGVSGEAPVVTTQTTNVELIYSTAKPCQ